MRVVFAERLYMFQIIDLQRHILQTQLEHLDSVESLTEEACARHDARVDEWYDERRMVVDDDEIAEDRAYLDELFQEQKAEANTIYPQIVRSSLFATAYGVFEYFMVSLCKHSERHLGGLSIRDLRGEGIVRAKLFLTKVAKIDFPETSQWNDLAIYGILRNSLVHAQGDISISDRAGEIEKLQKRVQTFSISNDRTRITLLKPFNEMFRTTVSEFANQLDDVWKDF